MFAKEIKIELSYQKSLLEVDQRIRMDPSNKISGSNIMHRYYGSRATEHPKLNNQKLRNNYQVLILDPVRKHCYCQYVGD